MQQGMADCRSNACHGLPTHLIGQVMPAGFYGASSGTPSGGSAARAEAADDPGHQARARPFESPLDSGAVAEDHPWTQERARLLWHIQVSLSELTIRESTLC